MIGRIMPSTEIDKKIINDVTNALVGEHKRYLEQFAANIDISYEELMEAARNYLSHGEYLSDGGKFEGVDVPDVFWDHFEFVENITVVEDRRGGFFSCSC